MNNKERKTKYVINEVYNYEEGYANTLILLIGYGLYYYKSINNSHIGVKFNHGIYEDKEFKLLDECIAWLLNTNKYKEVTRNKIQPSYMFKYEIEE